MFFNVQDQGGEDLHDIATQEHCTSNRDSVTEEDKIHTEIPDLDQAICASQEVIIDQNKRNSHEHLRKQGNPLLNCKCTFEIMHVTHIYS